MNPLHGQMPRVHHLRAARGQVRRVACVLMHVSFCKAVGGGVGGHGGRWWTGQGLERPDPFVPWPGPVTRCRRRRAAALRWLGSVAASRMSTRRADSARASCAAGTDAGQGRQRSPRVRRPSTIIVQYGQKRRDHRRRAARPPPRRAPGATRARRGACCSGRG